jgi:hypothetical protein
MSAFPRSPRISPRATSTVLVRAALLTTSALILAGCVSSHTSPFAGRSDVGNPAIALQRAHMAQMRKPDVAELEDDGLPVQTAPFRTRRPAVDDPSEPFSPNYGAPDTPRKRVNERQARTWQPDAAPKTTVAGWRQLSPVEAEILVSRALAAHERRHP